jgi:hypothetical protein
VRPIALSLSTGLTKNARVTKISCEHASSLSDGLASKNQIERNENRKMRAKQEEQGPAPATAVEAILQQLSQPVGSFVNVVTQTYDLYSPFQSIDSTDRAGSSERPGIYEDEATCP